MNSFKEEMKLT